MKKIIAGLVFLFLIIVAYWLQANMYFNHDAAIIYHTAALMLKGQTYAQGIIEPNPPMIFYLNFLPIMITNLFNLKMLPVFQIYMLTLAVISIICSQHIFKKIFQAEERLVYFMSYALIFVLLFLPVNAFGQREQFLLILTMPYIFLAAYRLENIGKKTSISVLFAILVGIMAGIGFSIKPYFLTTLILIELFFIYKKRNILGWLRIESSITLLTILIYGISVILFYPAYLKIIVPLWLSYYAGRMSPWLIILTDNCLLFCVSAVIMSFLFKKNEGYSSLKRLLSLTIIADMITFLIPRADWYYHIYPAVAMTCLYFALTIGELTKPSPDSSVRTNNWTFISGLSLTVFFIPLYLVISCTKLLISEFHSNAPMHQLITFLNQQSPSNTYNFFSISHKLNILEFHSTARYEGSFPFFWEFNRAVPNLVPEAIKKKNQSYLLDIVGKDLNEKQPRFIIIDTAASKDFLNEVIDYPREYSQYKPFREAWSHYQYLKSIKHYDIYQRSLG